MAELWKSSCLRVMDANFNRAKEALRVCEEVLRFILRVEPLSDSCKTLRHRLSRIFLDLPVSYANIVKTRDVRKDFGREKPIRDTKRTKPQDIFLANAKRAEEAVRVLEEFSRALFPGKQVAFERVRFGIYELEKEALKRF